MSYLDSNTFYRFSNEQAQPNSAEDTLFIELGQNHISSFIQSAQDASISWFEMKQFKEPISTELVEGYIARLPFEAASFEKCHVIHHCIDAVLLPSEHHVEHLDQTILETVSGDLFERVIKSEDVFQWEITNVYGVNTELFTSLEQSLPNASHLHTNSVFLKSIFRQLSDMHEQWVKVYFYPSSFTVLVIKDEKLQLLQSYYYETPEDVMYQLLNITEQLILDVTTLYLQVSGLIDEDSVLYTEMKKNFLEISLEASPVELKQSETATPPHYFTPILLSSLCV